VKHAGKISGKSIKATNHLQLLQTYSQSVTYEPAIHAV